jgi:hypothetical protein
MMGSAFIVPSLTASVSQRRSGFAVSNVLDAYTYCAQAFNKMTGRPTCLTVALDKQPNLNYGSELFTLNGDRISCCFLLKIM